MRRRQLVLLLLFGLLFTAGCGAESPSLSSLLLDVQAQQDVDNKKYEEALAKYFKMLEEKGDWAGAHSNIGVLLSLLQKPEEALKSLQHARELAKIKNDSKVLFSIHYNLGVYYGEQKKIKEALESYQAALDLVPDSIETKTNIELLYQQSDKNQKQGEGGEPQSKSEQGEQNQQQNQDNQGENNDEKESKDEGKRKEQSQGSPQYKPRPFTGENLSEGDVKKILGELRNQEKKIRANFDKKEKGKDQKNEKDW